MEVSYDVYTMKVHLTMHFSECISVVKWHVSVLHIALSVACSDVGRQRWIKHNLWPSPVGGSETHPEDEMQNAL